MSNHTSIIGSGPNGLAAAIAMAQAGYAVDVFEAEQILGGASRTLELTLPGFRHDFGSAVHPMAAGSPFFRSLPLAGHGLRWVHGLSALAHPLDDGTAVVLEQDLNESARLLGEDGPAWRRMTEPLARNWDAFAKEILGPLPLLPRHPLLLAGFGMRALLPSTILARSSFRSERTRALFAGMAAHSFLSLDAPLSSAIGIVLAASTHAVGWPVPAGGAQAIPDALAGYLRSLGGAITTGKRIASLDDLPASGSDLTFFDTAPRQLASIAGSRLPASFRQRLQRFQPGPGVFKIDYALSEPIPWTAADCRRAICLHLGGSFADIARSEDAMARGRISDRPFMILAQPSLFDPLRAPEGKHVVWVYCHVPNGCTVDRTEAIERQIERFAPGFRDCVLARHVSTPADLEAADANLIGGDISGGAMSVAQTFLRPTWKQYATPDPSLYLCSSSTPPGGGVHGMCGYRAAELALRRRR
ncbi:phytoene desaturase family protein [Silvibacterium sp.]|uniref:phytoene desaturase family protein n=1 Tax=Silvibacterium sp. TaxID=1964179 RepID=UPI0039E57859